MSLIIVPVFLAAAGAAGRWTFQWTETRLQIAVFLGLALAIEVFAEDFGLRRNWVRFGLSATAAICAIVAVRLHLEGPPHRVVAWLASRGA